MPDPVRLLVERHVVDVEDGVQRVFRIGLERCEQWIEIGRRWPFFRDELQGFPVRNVRSQASNQYLGDLLPRDDTVAWRAGMPTIPL
ncbi:hypothetical protein PMI07_005741 [Rhizobium sp. CF080]|nr:hypothetical protein PMI07_005741 [Rhizobium sp. CF080]